jgi:hypothetical protein
MYIELGGGLLTSGWGLAGISSSIPHIMRDLPFGEISDTLSLH